MDDVGEGLYGSPWLIVFRQPGSEDVVSQVRERCIDRGVGTELCPIDEVRQASLAHFTCLILILPSPLAGRSDLRPFARLIDDYRAGRPEGLVSIRNGSCKWFHAGVVQVVGQQLAAQHLKEIRSDLTDLVCVWHYTDDSEPLDVFLPYSARFVMPTQRSSQSSDIDRLWIYVQTWGITKRDDVPLLWNCIESCRAIFQNGNKYPVLHRPIPGFDKSMLDIILDVSESDFPPLISERIKQNNKFRKAYTENGARVYRHVRDELRKIAPELARPNGKEETRGAQKDLHKLYTGLRTIAIWDQLHE